jgi:hypothetical protein
LHGGNLALRAPGAVTYGKLCRGGQAGTPCYYALFAHPECAEQGGLVQFLSYFDPNTGAQRSSAGRPPPEHAPIVK